MPQLQILPAAPSFGSELGKALGGGFGKGVSEGLQERLNTFHDEKLKLEKNRVKHAGTHKFHKNEFGFKDIPEEDNLEIFKAGRKYIEQGFDHDEAVEKAFQDYRLKSEEEIEDKEPPSFAKRIGEIPVRALAGLSGAIPELLSGAKKIFAPPEERAPKIPRENIPERLEEAEKLGPQVYNKFLSTLSNEEFMSLPRNKQIELSQQLGQQIIPQEVGQTLARGILGRGGAERLAQAGGLPTVEFGTEPAQAVGETTGRLLRDLGLFQAAGQFAGLGKRAGAAGGLFGGAAAGEQALAGEAPTIGTVAPAALFGAGAEVAPEILGRLFRFLGNKLPIKRAVPGKRPPAIKEIEFKPGKIPPPPTPGPQTAQEAQSLYNDIVNESVKNLSERGITLEAINAGDPTALKELQKESNKVAGLFKDAEKINLKEFQKQQKDILKKIPESPLEKYYAPKKEVVRKPETIAKELERIKPIETSIKQNERRVRDLQYQILSADEQLRSGVLNAQEAERVRATRKVNAFSHAKAMDAIKNAKFDIKYGRPPATSEEIGKQITDTFEKLREGIKNPSAKKVELFRKGFERDKALIDDAQRLAARGRLPGPEVFDEYIKIHREYVKSYDDLLNELKDFISENKGKPKLSAKVKNAENLAKIVKNNQKLGKAKIALQEDKRKALRILEKPSGAFIKNSLRDTKRDIEAFQKDFFKWNKIAEGPEKKVAEIAKEKIKPLPKVAEKAKDTAKEFKETAQAAEAAAKDPTGPKLKSAAERAGMTKEEYQEYIRKIRNKMEDAGAKIKLGTASPETEKGIIKDLLLRYKKLPQIPKALVGGVIIGTIQGVGEEVFGKKIPQTLLFLPAYGAIKGGVGTRTGAGAIASLVSNFIRKTFNSASANRLKELRKNPREYNAHYRKLQSKYGNARAAKIRREALQSS
jgi:hypothetical protein